MIAVYDGVDDTGKNLATIEPTVPVTLFYGVTLVTGLFVKVTVAAANFDVILADLDAPGSAQTNAENFANAAVAGEAARAEAAESVLASEVALAPVVHRIAFAYNTPGLVAGAPLYVPKIGDVLLDAWIEVDTAWDGTTPLGDFGLFANSFPGFLATIGTAISESAFQDMTAAVSAATLGVAIDPAANNDAAALSSHDLLKQYVPCKFVTADPVCVCVTRTGLPGGASPGSTKGAAALCIITATPAGS